MFIVRSEVMVQVGFMPQKTYVMWILEHFVETCVEVVTLQSVYYEWEISTAVSRPDSTSIK